MTMKKKIAIFILLVLVCLIALEITTKEKFIDVAEYMAVGNEMGIIGNHVEAGKAFKRALNMDPYYVPAYLGLGIAYANAGRNKEAIEVLKEGIKLNFNHSSVPKMQISIASIAFNRMNDQKTAVQFAKKALQKYTDQRDYAGVALAGHKLKQFNQGH